MKQRSSFFDLNTPKIKIKDKIQFSVSKKRLHGIFKILITAKDCSLKTKSRFQYSSCVASRFCRWVALRADFAVGWLCHATRT